MPKYTNIEDIIRLINQSGKLPDNLQLHDWQKEYLRRHPNIILSLPPQAQTELFNAIKPGFLQNLSEFAFGAPEESREFDVGTPIQRQLSEQAGKRALEGVQPSGLESMVSELLMQQLPQYFNQQSQQSFFPSAYQQSLYNVGIDQSPFMKELAPKLSGGLGQLLQGLSNKFSR